MRRSSTHKTHPRRGWLAPILALVLFVVLGLLALVLDRLWLDMAQTEAEVVAETSALAAARELASDDTLRIPNPGPENYIERATLAAINVAAMNSVVGQSFTLDPNQGDILFGSNLQADDDGEVRFVESIYEARSVRVLAQRTRTRRNPVALFFGGLTRLPAGDVAAMAEATLDNHIVGLQTIGGARIPALPMAILAYAPMGSTAATWNNQIELRRGGDRYRYDPLSQLVEAGSDGIPEIMLTPAMYGAPPAGSNMRLFCIQKQPDSTQFEDQIRLGWSEQHLEHRDGRILMTQGPELFKSVQSIRSDGLTALKEIIGQCRVVMLFQEEWAAGNDGWGQIQSAGMVAGRVMAVIERQGQSPQIVFQPAVLATRSAMVLTDLDAPATTSSTAAPASTVGNTSSTTTQPGLKLVVPANKYLYQLKLTQ
ncbi:MAG: hypothetical protein JWM11_2887 [Planctomycetaceae bacterium]|nr:hypothetical protein [Planctomycetaceae bacterium]